MKTVQLTIRALKEIIRQAESLQEADSSLSSTIEITQDKECETHLGNDSVTIFLKSSYSECIGKHIQTIIL